MKEPTNSVTRRDFVKHTAAGIAGLAAGASPLHAAAQNKMPTRTLGKTGLKVSLLSFGGGSQFLANPNGKWETLMQQALDAGVNLFDTASSYKWSHPQSSEERYGEILSSCRDRVFISTKFDSRNTSVAMNEFERSLQRLRTDYVDILLIHDVNNSDTPSALEEGVYKEMVKLRDEGTARFIGFSSMNSAFRARECIEALDFDVVLLTLNPTAYGNNAKIAVPAAKKKNIGVMAMKVMRDIVNKKAPPKELLEYVWEMDGVQTAVVGHIGSETLEENARLTRQYGFAGIEKSLLYCERRRALEKQHADLAGPHGLCWARPDYSDRVWG